MLAIQTILHPTDFSDRSKYALHFACALARDYDARLVILHVAPMPTIVYGEGVVPPDPQEMIQEAQQDLNALALPDADLRAERRMEMGDPATTILEVAQEISADVIAMGTHGRTGLFRLLMGSVAELVARRASCPVITVTSAFAKSYAPSTPVWRASAAMGGA